MIGYNNGCCSRFLRLQCTLHCHNALHDKRRTSHFCNGLQILDGFAACRRIHILQERQTGCIHIHSHCKSTGLLHQIHLLTDRIQIPRLHCRNTHAAGQCDRICCRFHHLRICTVTCKSNNAIFCTGRNKDFIIRNIIICIAVMQVHSPYRSRKKRILELLSKEFKGCIHCLRRTQCIHIHSDLLPLLVIANGRIADTLGSGTRNGVAACQTIADRTGLT